MGTWKGQRAVAPPTRHCFELPSAGVGRGRQGAKIRRVDGVPAPPKAVRTDDLGSAWKPKPLPSSRLMSRLHLRPAVWSWLSKIGQLLLTLFVVSVITFGMLNALPGSAAANRIGPLPGFTPAQRHAVIESLTRQLGLNQPLPIQYWDWLRHIIVGNFGLTVQGTSVTGLIGSRIGATLELAVAAALLTIIGSIGFAVLTFRSRGRLVRWGVGGVMSSLLVVPAFWLGLLLVLAFADKLAILPASGYVALNQSLGSSLTHLILPLITLSVSQIALVFRYVYSGLQDSAVKPFVVATRARGVSERRIAWTCVLPNGILPSITIMGMVIGSMMSSLVIVETVFSWPGLGSLLVQSVENKDYNTVAAIVMIAAATFVALSLVVDAAYRLIDPRLRTPTA